MFLLALPIYEAIRIWSFVLWLYICIRQRSGLLESKFQIPSPCIQVPSSMVVSEEDVSEESLCPELQIVPGTSNTEFGIGRIRTDE
ncbi:hypothetical protein GBA52_026416 [Prunus armeniaca]|nr:hypothetical protein GBA52_026416 [Prunus armeniaca]